MTITCEICGSDKIIPDVRIVDERYGPEGSLKVKIEGNPNSFFFRDALYGTLRADICGECGHTELKVENPRELYQKYQKALKSSK